jgi:hypothetical protein
VLLREISEILQADSIGDFEVRPYYDDNKMDNILAEEFARFLRLYIPALWEDFERGLTLPLQDRTKCPFAQRPPVVQFILDYKKGDYCYHFDSLEKCKE